MIRLALPVLFEAVLRALVAASVLGVGLRLLRVKNVRAQKAAWSVMLAAGIAMPLFMLSHWIPAWSPTWAVVRLPAPAWSRIIPNRTLPAPAVRAMAAPSPVPATAPEPIPVTRKTDSLPRALVVKRETLPDTKTVSVAVAAPAPPVAASPAPQKTNRSPLNPLTIAWLVYLAVGATLVFRWLIGLASSIRLWIKATPVMASELGNIIATRSSTRIFSPVNIGSGIVLPANYPEWPPEKLRAVLAHEGSHVRQGDFYLQLLAGLYTALTWFSPLGWWLKRRLSELSEAISDRAGLEESRSRSAYAQLLLEFAALPRPTLTGVAMARSNNLSHRIDRLLNESSFKQAFSGSRRAFVAALIVPVVLVTATALFRVQAAAAPEHHADSSEVAALSKDQMPSYSAVTGELSPAPAQSADSGAVQTPAPSPAPEAAPSPDAAPRPSPSPAPAPVPPTPSADDQAVPAPPPLSPGTMELFMPRTPAVPPASVEVQVPPAPPLMLFMHGYRGQSICLAGGDDYAIVGDPGTPTRFCGNTRGEMEAEVEKARTMAHGHFLLFRHDGKCYIVDDPAIVGQIEAMDKNLHDQGEQMRALGEQFRDSSRQVRDEARDEARKATANIPAPDLSKEMADLNASVADLKARQGATVSREELQQVQRQISEIQRRVIEAEVNTDMKNFNADFNSKFKVDADKFNEQMRQMGSALGQTVQENQQKIGSIIDDSLKNGKAKPVN